MHPAVHFAALFAVAGSLVAFGGARSAPPREDEPPIDDAALSAAAIAPDDVGEDGAADDDDDGDSESDENVAGDPSLNGASLADGPDGGRKRPLRGGCPSTMVRAGNFCIDRYEAPN